MTSRTDTPDAPALRLDTALVRRGLTASRTRAARLIAARRVTVAGRVVTKPATAVTDDTPVHVADGDDFASRGAGKLLPALDECRIAVTGRRALDAGASTGGFTDVLLRRGAASVAAVDVGHDQLVPALRDDPRVHVFDGLNLRDLAAEHRTAIAARLGGRPQIVVADLSFISLRQVLPALLAVAADGADVLPMVKPQFEVGRGRLGAGGVVRDPALRAEAVTAVAAAAAGHGWGVVAAVPSPLPGPGGNVEYFLHLRADHPPDPRHAERLIGDAVARGPR